MRERPVFKENTLSRKTGSWRDPEMKQKPRYLTAAETVSPCKAACPLENDIAHWICLLKDGKNRQAWESLMLKDPLPASVGRVCRGFCEASCNRKEFDEALSIKNLERLLGDEALYQGWKIKSNEAVKPQRVAIVGGGPAGLSCAYQLARNGYRVAIFERLPELGGLLMFGIPGYRLPKDILKSEIQNNILSLGLQVNTNFEMRFANMVEILPRHFDAVFIATGLWASKNPAIPGAENQNVIFALDFLSDFNLGRRPKVGEKVLVIGAGDTGIDAARVSLILGAKEVSIIELKKEEKVAVSLEEKELARKEGVKMQYETKILRIKSSDGKMEIFCQNDEAEWSAKGIDAVIVAIGQYSEISPVEEGKIFIGGDLKTWAGSVASALGSGRKAAEAIDYYLRTGKRIAEPEKQLKIVSFKDINIAYFKKQNRGKFLAEAKRCFSCGLCRECENCFNFCPEPAIKKTGNSEQPYAIDYDYCKGCGICAKECPRGVIVMEEE